MSLEKICTTYYKLADKYNQERQLETESQLGFHVRHKTTCIQLLVVDYRTFASLATQRLRH